jgi:hypothetical protein
MAWQPPWRGSGGRSWPATREFPRSARDAEKPAPELDPTCSRRRGPADRRKEDALKWQRGKPVLRDARRRSCLACQRWIVSRWVYVRTRLPEGRKAVLATAFGRIVPWQTRERSPT